MSESHTGLSLDLCTPEGKTWLARITGTDPQYGLARKFQRAASRVTSGSGKTGTVTYLVFPGIYERHEGRRRLRENNGFFEFTEDSEIKPLADAAAVLDALSKAARL